MRCFNFFCQGFAKEIIGNCAWLADRNSKCKHRKAFNRFKNRVSEAVLVCATHELKQIKKELEES